MSEKIKYLAKLKQYDWESNRMIFYFKAEGLVKNMWIFLSIWGVLTILPILIVLKVKWTIPFILSLLVMVISSIIIDKKGSLTTKYIQITIGCLYLTFIMFYQFYIVSFYSDNATIPFNVFMIYTVVFIILIISSPFVSYLLAKIEFEDENPNIDKRKKPPKIITYVGILIGSTFILAIIFANYFSIDFQFRLVRVVLFFIMYMFLLVANSSFINASIIKINDNELVTKL